MLTYFDESILLEPCWSIFSHQHVVNSLWIFHVSFDSFNQILSCLNCQFQDLKEYKMYLSFRCSSIIRVQSISNGITRRWSVSFHQLVWDTIGVFSINHSDLCHISSDYGSGVPTLWKDRPGNFVPLISMPSRPPRPTIATYLPNGSLKRPLMEGSMHADAWKCSAGTCSACWVLQNEEIFWKEFWMFY